MKAKSKQNKFLVADKTPEKLMRLKALSERIHGKCENFMTQEDLKRMREDEKWERLPQARGQ